MAESEAKKQSLDTLFNLSPKPTATPMPILTPQPGYVPPPLTRMGPPAANPADVSMESGNISDNDSDTSSESDISMSSDTGSLHMSLSPNPIRSQTASVSPRPFNSVSPSPMPPLFTNQKKASNLDSLLGKLKAKIPDTSSATDVSVKSESSTSDDNFVPPPPSLTRRAETASPAPDKSRRKQAAPKPSEETFKQATPTKSEPDDPFSAVDSMLMDCEVVKPVEAPNSPMIDVDDDGDIDEYPVRISRKGRVVKKPSWAQAYTDHSTTEDDNDPDYFSSEDFSESGRGGGSGSFAVKSTSDSFRPRRAPVIPSFAAGARIPQSDLPASMRSEPKPEWLIPFKKGWIRELVIRNPPDDEHMLNPNAKFTNADAYYYAPKELGSVKLRSLVKIEEFLDQQEQKTGLSSIHFTFQKRAVYQDPEEFVRMAGKTGVTVKSRKPSPQKQVKPEKVASKPPVKKVKGNDGKARPAQPSSDGTKSALQLLSNFKSVSSSTSSLPGISLPGSSLPGSSLPGISLSGISLPRRSLPGSSLSGSRLIPQTRPHLAPQTVQVVRVQPPSAVSPKLIRIVNSMGKTITIPTSNQHVLPPKVVQCTSVPNTMSVPFKIITSAGNTINVNPGTQPQIRTKTPSSLFPARPIQIITPTLKKVAISSIPQIISLPSAVGSRISTPAAGVTIVSTQPNPISIKTIRPSAPRSESTRIHADLNAVNRAREYIRHAASHDPPDSNAAMTVTGPPGKPPASLQKILPPCNRSCPRVEPFAVPTLQCGVCLLLYHHQCVNWASSNTDSLFVCSRCILRARHPNFDSKYKLSTNDGRKVELFDGSTRLIETLGAKNSNNNNAIEVNSKPEVSSKPKGRWITIPSTALSKIDKAAPFALKLSTGTYRINPKNMEVTSNGMSLKVYVAESSLMPYSSKVTSSVPAAPSETPSQAMKRAAPSQTTASKIIAPLTVIYNKLSDHLSSSKSSSKSTIAVTKPSNQKNCDKSKSPEPTNPSSVNNLASIQKDSEESSNQRQVADNESTNGKNLSEVTNDSSSVNSSETSNESEDDEGALAIDEANTSEESNETPADINSGSIETEKPPVTTENDDSSKLEPSSEPYFPGPPAGLTAEFQALNSPTSDQKATRPCPNMSEPEMGVEATPSAIKSNRETAHSIQDSRDDLNGSEREAPQGAENSGLETTPIIVGLKADGVRDKFEEANPQNDLRRSEEATRGAETCQLEAKGGGTRSHCETDSISPRSNQDVKQSAHKSCCDTGEGAKHSSCEVPESGDATAGECCGDFHQELDEVSPMAKTPKFETSKAVNSSDAVATKGCGNSVNPETSTALGEQLGVKDEKVEPLVVRPLKPLRLVTSGSSIGCDGVKEDEHNPEIIKGADNLKAADRDGDGDETEEIKPGFNSATISSLDGNVDSNSDATSAKSRSSEDITGDQMDTLDDENSIPPRKSNKELELIEKEDGTAPKPDENLNVITDVVNLLVQAVDIYAKSLDLADKAERELLNQTSTPQKPSTSLSDNAFIRNALYDKQDEDKKMKDLNKPCDPRHPKLGDKVPSMSELLYDPPSPIPSSPAFTYTYGRSSSSQSRRTPDVAIRSLNRTPRPLSGSMGSNSAALYQSVGQPRGVASNLATQGQPRGVAKNLATQGQPRGVFNNMMTQGQPRGVFNSMVMQGQPRGVANKITTLAKTMQRPLQTFTSPATQSILSSRPKPCVPAQHTVLPGNYKGQPPRIISNSSSAGKQTVVVSSTDSRVIVVPTLAAVPRRSIFVPRIVVTASPPPRVLSPPLTATGARFSTARLVPVSSSLTNSNRARHPPISAVDPSTGFSRIVLTPPVHSSAPTLKLIRAPAYPQIVQSAGYSQTTIQPRGTSAIVTIYQKPTEKQAPYVSQSNAFLTTERNIHTGRSIPTLPVQSVTSKSNVVTIRPPPSYIIPPSHPMTNVSTTSAISQFKLSPATTTSQSASRSQGWLSVQTNTNVPATRRSINVNRTTGTQTLKHLTDKICRSCSKKKAPTRSILSQSNDLYTVLQLVFCGKESPFGDYHLSIPDLTSCASVCRLWRLIAAESLTQRELEPQPQIENWYSSQAVGIPYYEMEGENDLETSMQFTVEAIQSDDEYADQSDDLYSDQLNTGIYDLETSQVLQSADCVLPARASDEKYECQTGVVNTDASGSSSQDNGNDAERANKTDNQSETVEGGATGKSSDDNPNTYSNEPIGDNNEATTGELIADNDETTTGELIADNNEVIEGENVALQISMLDSDSDIDSGSLDGFHVGNVQGNVESATDSAADSMAADFLTDEINQAAGATENTQTGTSQTNQAGAPEATPADATDTNPADTTKTTPGDATETHPADATTTSGLTTETN